MWLRILWRGAGSKLWLRILWVAVGSIWWLLWLQMSSCSFRDVF
jgi:hypothetical protein